MQVFKALRRFKIFAGFYIIYQHNTTNFDIIPEPNENENVIQAFTDSEKIYEYIVDCNNPLCHEVFFINEQFANKTFRLEHLNGKGNKQYKIEIKK